MPNEYLDKDGKTANGAKNAPERAPASRSPIELLIDARDELRSHTRSLHHIEIALKSFNDVVSQPPTPPPAWATIPPHDWLNYTSAALTPLINDYLSTLRSMHTRAVSLAATVRDLPLLVGADGAHVSCQETITSQEAAESLGTRYGIAAMQACEFDRLSKLFYERLDDLETINNLQISTYLREHGYMSLSEMESHYWKALRECHKAEGFLGLSRIIGTKHFQNAAENLERAQQIKDGVKQLSEGLNQLRKELLPFPHLSPRVSPSHTFENYLEARSLLHVRAAHKCVDQLNAFGFSGVIQQDRHDYEPLYAGDSPAVILARMLGRYVASTAPEGVDLWRLGQAKDFIHQELTHAENGGSPPTFSLLPYETQTLLRPLMSSRNQSIALSVTSKLLACAIAPDLLKFRNTLANLLPPPVESAESRGGVAIFHSWPLTQALEKAGERMDLLNHSPSLIRELSLDPECEVFIRALQSNDMSDPLITKEGLALGRAVMEQHLVSTLLSRKEHESETVALGYELFSIKKPEVLPIILMNSLRETGHSGERPFISSTSYGKAPLVQRALQLTNEDVQFLDSYPCQDLRIAFDSLRTHGDHALHPRIVGENGNFEANPAYVQFVDAATNVIIHFLTNGTELEKRFMGGVIRSLDAPLSSSLQTAIIGALNTSAEVVKAELIRGVVGKALSSPTGHDLSEVIIKSILTYPERGRDADAKTNALAALYHALPRQNRLRPDVINTLASTLHLSPTIIKAIPDTQDTLTNNGVQFDTFSESRAGQCFNQLYSLSAAEGLSSALSIHYFAPHISPAEQSALMRITVQHIRECKTATQTSSTTTDSVCRAFATLARAAELSSALDGGGFTTDPRFQRVFSSLWDVAKNPEHITQLVNEVTRDPRGLFNCLYIASFAPQPQSILTPECLEHLKIIAPPDSSSDGTLVYGVPLLKDLEWLTPELLPSVAAAIPALRREGGLSADSWISYRANLSGGRASFLLKLPEAVTRELSSLLEFSRDFPIIQAPLIYEGYRSIGTPFAESKLSELGLEHKDRRAVHELKVRIRSLRERSLESELPIDLSKRVESELFVALIGATDSPEIIRERALIFARSYEAGLIAPIDPAFRDTRLSVELLDKQRIKTFTFSEPTATRYHLFTSELADIRNRPLKDLIQQEREGVLQHLTEMQSHIMKALESNGSFTGGERKGREIEIERIEQTIKAIQSAGDLTDFIKALCDYRYKDNPVTVPSLRRISLRLALDEMPNSDALFASLGTDPSKDSLESLAALITQNLKHEALPRHALNEKQLKVIQIAVGTSAFEDDFKRLAMIGSERTEEILVHPTRGLLAEMSGFNCGACWDRERDLMARYPNATALMFIRNPDDEARKRIVGACMVLQGRDTHGNSVIIVRGLNPTQNFITSVKASSFFEQLIDTTFVPLARALGATKIAIPGGGSGGAQTNRPSINEYVNSKYGNSPLVEFDPEGPDTTFNGYVLANTCRLVRTVPS